MEDTQEIVGASGLGEEMARQFAKAGFVLLIHDLVSVVVLIHDTARSLQSEICQAKMPKGSSQKSASMLCP